MSNATKRAQRAKRTRDAKTSLTNVCVFLSICASLGATGAGRTVASRCTCLGPVINWLLRKSNTTWSSSYDDFFYSLFEKKVIFLPYKIIEAQCHTTLHPLTVVMLTHADYAMGPAQQQAVDCRKNDIEKGFRIYATSYWILILLFFSNLNSNSTRKFPIGISHVL